MKERKKFWLFPIVTGRSYKEESQWQTQKGKTVSLEGFMVSTLTMTDALAKLLIEKGVITDAEFTKKLLEKRAVYK
jgi:hypothetical protein